MEKQRMLELASNPKTTPEVLAQIVASDFDVDCLLARHPNATEELLRRLSKCADDWRWTAVGQELPSKCLLGALSEWKGRILGPIMRHPNAPIDLLKAFGYLYPADILDNPRIHRIATRHRSVLHSVAGDPHNLELPGWPENYLRQVAKRGTRRERAAIARNPALPVDLRAILAPEALFQSDISSLLSLASKQNNGMVRRCIELYANTSRPCATPSFLPFDRANPDHRVANQIFCGFPYTSIRWPWPTEELGDYMQPLVQIDLTVATGILGVDLGSGLLQAWGGINFSKTTELMVRVIPRSDLTDDLDWFYPHKAPWLDKYLRFDDCVVHHCMIPEDVAPFSPDYCRVEWVEQSRMFYPTISSRIFFCHKSDEVDWLSQCDYGEIGQEIHPLDEDTDIFSSNSATDVSGKSCFAYLGGYEPDLGNCWGRYGENLLFYYSDDDGVMINIGITYQRNEAGQLEFKIGLGVEG